MNRLASNLVAALWSVLLIVQVGLAQTSDADGIRFLKLRVTADSVELIESTTRPGRLKPKVEAGRAIQYEALREDGSVGWGGDLEDPLRERLEYVDEDGRLKNHYRLHEEAVVLIRVPASIELKTLRVFGPSRSDEVGKATAGSVFLGTIDLDR